MKTLDYIKLNESGVNNVVASLQQLLADFQIYYTNLRGFHWNIKGHDFFVLHSKFEDLYNDAAEKVDEIAERILMLGGTPANKFSDYLKMSNINEVDRVSNGEKALENILETYSHLIGEERKLLSIASQAGDEVTVALMSDYLKEQEKMVWMLTAYNKQISPPTASFDFLFKTKLFLNRESHNLRLLWLFLLYDNKVTNQIILLFVKYIHSVISI